MKKTIICILVLMVFCLHSRNLFAGQKIIAKKVEKVPVIDGKEEISIWGKAQSYTTHDKIAGIDITLKAVYTDKEICFLVSFPDPDETRTHKSWIWNGARKIYEIGNDREDTFVFKWNMEPHPEDLSIFADNSYRADIWFWKACRTDSKGYADDKLHVLSFSEVRDAAKLVSRKNKNIYLLRKEDSGVPVYKTTLRVEYEGDVLPRFVSREPEGSRADVRAKGVWMNGRWMIEFKRLLKTGHNDDVLFFTKLSKGYQFGVSRYEIAGRKPNPKLNQPLYGAGDISESLVLYFGDTD